MKKSWQVFWHVFFWLGVMSFFMYLGTIDMKMNLHSLLIVYVLYPSINISLFYLNYLVFIPHFFNKKRYSLYIISLVLAVVAYGLFKYMIGLLFFKQDVLTHMTGHEMGFWIYFWMTVFSSLMYIFLSVALKFGVDWFTNERIQRDLENQRLSAELSFLKSQINPHFLFNSLNSIYSLAYQRSETTPEAILKLSEIMRYMLYECNDNKVDLSKELQYLQNYIDLQKIRFGKKSYIDFKVNGKVDSQQIVPLLLIAFIENAFKHGIANDPLSPISLLIDVDAEHLHFYIRNKKHNNNRDTMGGIGLSNVRRRLDLLYPRKYNLEIIEDEHTYTCELALVL